MFYVYVLESKKDDSLYVGYTNDLVKRFKEHNRGRVHSTKRKIPWILIHYEAYLNSRDTTRRERYLKTNQGARLLKRMLKEYFYDKKHE
jgi:putative endonuclease